MKPIRIVLLSGVMVGSFASHAIATDLDLRLPDSTRFGAPYAPPGTLAEDLDDPVEDDGKAKIHGSFTTGIGYSEGLGSTRYNAAHVNISKSVGEERQGQMSLDLEVRKIDGPGAGYGMGYDDYYDVYDGPGRGGWRSFP